MEPHGPGEQPHVPPPSLWPVGFAVGVAVLLTGLVVSWWIVLLGAVIAVVFGFLWVRDVAGGHETAPPLPEPERRDPGMGAAPAQPGEAALPLASEGERFPRSRFLEGATLGIGGLIGAGVTLPAVGLAVLPPFIDQENEAVNLGPVDDFPEGEYRIVTFMEDPARGEVTRRTVFVRYNGELSGSASFTIIANNCVHLGCPVQPSGPVDEEGRQEVEVDGQQIAIIPTQPAAFACPCHGGAYDTEGNRTAGPPVRALDRYQYRIENGNLVITQRYSVGEVRGEGTEAVIEKYDLMTPGVHVDGPEQILYPIEAPR